MTRSSVASAVVAFPRPPVAPTLPRFEAAFRAVEETLKTLGIDRPHELRSPATVEEALAGAASLEGTLVIIDPNELRSAELDLEETVADERGGGTFFVSLPTFHELTSRRIRFRDLGSSSTGVAFLDEDVHPVGFGKFRFARKPAGYRRWRILIADTPGFRVALVSRPIAGGGFVGLWTGNPEMVDEIVNLLRGAAQASGHELPPSASAVPVSLGIASEDEVWRQAAALRGQREVREGELREIARAAALRGVEIRRLRAAAAAAPHPKVPAA